LKKEQHKDEDEDDDKPNFFVYGKSLRVNKQAKDEEDRRNYLHVNMLILCVGNYSCSLLVDLYLSLGRQTG